MMKSTIDLTDEKLVDEQTVDSDAPKERVAAEASDDGQQEQPDKEQRDKASENKEKEEDEELQTKYLRLAADFQNYKRRIEKEKSDIYAFANEKLMAELLNVIDNFDRALAVETADTGVKEGMTMIFKQLIDVLEKSGLEEIDAYGLDFDPNYHHAVQMVNSDLHSSGLVAEVLQKGYMLNKKVIRPSMVIVAE